LYKNPMKEKTTNVQFKIKSNVDYVRTIHDRL